MTLMEVPGSVPQAIPPELDRLREANHRIANHLTVIVGMVQRQAAKLAKGPRSPLRDEAVGTLRDVAGKIVMIGHLHRRLAAHPHLDAVDLAGYLIESCTDLTESLSMGGGVHLVQRLDANCQVTPDQAQQIGLMVSEIIMNAAKHAHPAGLPVQILVGCHHGRDNRILLTIADDGVGLPESFDLKKSGGTGLRLIRSIADALDADLDIESDSLGLSFRLLLPPSIRSTTLRVVAAD
jgi:two-component sensor histidine kinase